jgi:hypothetical protein
MGWNRAAGDHQGDRGGDHAAMDAAIAQFGLLVGPEFGYSGVSQGRMGRPSGKCRSRGRDVRGKALKNTLVLVGLVANKTRCNLEDSANFFSNFRLDWSDIYFYFSGNKYFWRKRTYIFGEWTYSCSCWFLRGFIGRCSYV